MRWLRRGQAGACDQCGHVGQKILVPHARRAAAMQIVLCATLQSLSCPPKALRTEATSQSFTSFRYHPHLRVFIETRNYCDRHPLLPYLEEGCGRWNDTVPGPGPRPAYPAAKRDATIVSTCAKGHDHSERVERTVMQGSNAHGFLRVRNKDDALKNWLKWKLNIPPGGRVPVNISSKVKAIDDLLPALRTGLREKQQTADNEGQKVISEILELLREDSPRPSKARSSTSAWKRFLGEGHLDDFLREDREPKQRRVFDDDDSASSNASAVDDPAASSSLDHETLMQQISALQREKAVLSERVQELLHEAETRTEEMHASAPMPTVHSIKAHLEKALSPISALSGVPDGLKLGIHEGVLNVVHELEAHIFLEADSGDPTSRASASTSSVTLPSGAFSSLAAHSAASSSLAAPSGQQSGQEHAYRSAFEYRSFSTSATPRDSQGRLPQRGRTRQWSYRSLSASGRSHGGGTSDIRHPPVDSAGATDRPRADSAQTALRAMSDQPLEPSPNQPKGIFKSVFEQLGNSLAMCLRSDIQLPLSARIATCTRAELIDQRVAPHDRSGAHNGAQEQPA